MSYKNLKKPNCRFLTALALGLALTLTGCGSGGKKGEGLLGDPAPNTSSSSSSGATTSSSTSSGGQSSGSIVDPNTNATLKVSIVAEPGAISYGQTRKITLTLTDSKGAAIEPTFTVSASSNCLSVKDASISAPNLSDNVINFVYTTLGCLGDDPVIFTATGSGKSVELGRVKIVTKGETVAFITEVGKPTPNKIYIGGEGTPRVSVITFKVTGQSGEPLSGQPVVFSNAGVQGGISIDPSTDTSDKDGLVTTRVTAGTVPTIAAVKALHEESRVEGSSSSLDVSSSLPSAGKFTLSARAYNLRAYNIDKEESTTISATLLDTSGGGVPDGTTVKFFSNEQGQVLPTSCPTVNGECTVKFVPNGLQPPDGRVQILAYALGSEAFKDNNSNKVFDNGDGFDASMDLAEPYSDDNDNGQYDFGEFFVDANQNNARDEADGKWNGINCKHDTLCAANKSQLVALSKQVTFYLSNGGVSVCEPGDFAGTLWVQPGQTKTFGSLYLSDTNRLAINEAGHGCLTGNPLPNGTKLEFTGDGGSIKSGDLQTIGDNEIYPNGPYAVTFAAPDKAGLAFIKLKASQPARNGLAEKIVTLTWPVVISDTPPDQVGGNPDNGTSDAFLDPSLNQKLIADVTTSEGPFSYGVPKDITLSFTTEAGVAQATTSQIVATSACLATARSQITQPTTLDNTVKFTYTAKGCVGDDVISFSATSAGKTVAVRTYKIVTEGESVGGLLFESAVPTQIPIATDGPSSAGLSTVTFKVVGPSGNGVSGEQVEFAIDGIAGGVTLVNLTDISDSQGFVRTKVKAGTTPNNVTVIATHAASKASKRSEGLTVASGLALKGNFTMGISVFNPHSYNILALPGSDHVSVSVGVRDASGNAVLDGTVVNFSIPEAGIVTSSCQTVKGGCAVGWRPTGVQPLDGRVRMAAIVKASEHFTDNNGNLIFDAGDVFTAADDLPEPYVDLNEDNDYQVGEPFTDSNLNGVRDLADGKWNGLNCQHPTLCGSSKSVDLQVSSLIHLAKLDPTICSAGTFGNSGSTLTVTAGQTLSLSGLMFSDGNTNALNPGYICPTGNSLPNGTEISSKVSGGTILAGGTFKVTNVETLPNGAYYLLYKAPTTAGTEALTISVGGRDFFWTINVTAPPTP